MKSFNIPTDLSEQDAQLVQSLVSSRGKRKGLLKKSTPDYKTQPERWLLWQFVAPMLEEVSTQGMSARIFGHHAVGKIRHQELVTLADRLVAMNTMRYEIQDDQTVVLVNGHGLAGIFDWADRLNAMNERHLAVVVLGIKLAEYDYSEYNINVIASNDDLMATMTSKIKELGIGAVRKAYADMSQGSNGGNADQWINAVWAYFQLGGQPE